MGGAGTLEEMVKAASMDARQDVWRGKRVLLTGHTGFKGSWLSLWLKQWGAEVFGFSLPPETPSLFLQAGLDKQINGEYGDLREPATIARVVKAFQPQVVLHLAAQPIVRLSYQDPVGTYATNVMGTVHLLEAVRHTPGIHAVTVVTSDKCYENVEWVWGYRENDRLGGHDPYSNSKACAELVAAAYRTSYFSGVDAPLLATARAGNVVGGGDWAKDRLIPDAMRAFAMQQPLVIRYPAAVRPWQHVLEALNGYLVLTEGLMAGNRALAEGWNFGPLPQSFRAVEDVVQRLVALWGGQASYRAEPVKDWHEAGLLTLDVTKAMRHLPWQPQLELDAALSLTVAWYQAVHRSPSSIADFSLKQIDDFVRQNNQSIAKRVS